MRNNFSSPRDLRRGGPDSLSNIAAAAREIVGSPQSNGVRESIGDA
jgi:hypothetical protein